MGGVFTKAGVSASACFGIAFGGCASVSYNRKNGLQRDVQWTGMHEKRFFYGMSSGISGTYQSHKAQGSARCFHGVVAASCGSQGGRRTRVYSLQIPKRGAGAVFGWLKS